MCRISLLEEAQTVMLNIQMDSAGSEFELLLSRTGHQRTALGRLKAQSVSFTCDKLTMRRTVATSATSG